MKIAILICGLSRNYKKTFESFRNAFSNYDFDAYMHTWTLGENSLKSKTNSGEKVDKIYPVEDELKKLFNLKKIKIDEQNINEIPGIKKLSRESHPNIPLCYHESIKRCFNLLDEHYDICVVVRPDLIFYDKINLFSPEKNVIYVPYINNLYEGKHVIKKLKSQHPNSIVDMLYNCFAYGTQEDMKVYADFTDEYVNLCENEEYYTSGRADYNPDRALAIYTKLIRKKNIVEFRTKHGILRENNVQLYSW